MDLSGKRDLVYNRGRSAMRPLLVSLVFALPWGCGLVYDSQSLVGDPSSEDGGVLGADAESGIDVLVDPPDGGPPVSPDAGADAAVNPYVAAVLADSPLIYLRLGERSGTVAKDEVGTTNGTYALASIGYGAAGAVVGDPDTAISFVGNLGAVTMPPSAEFDGVKPFTVEIWARRDSTSSSFGPVVDHETFEAPGRSGWLLRVGTDATAFERWSNDTGNSAVGVPVESGWHHVVGVFSGTRLYVFVDGQNRGDRPSTLAIPTLGKSYTVGNQNCGCGGNAYVGDLDEFAIYDRALTETQIRAHFAAAGR